MPCGVRKAWWSYFFYMKNISYSYLLQQKVSAYPDNDIIRHFFLLHFPPFTARLTSHAWERWRGSCDVSVTSPMPSSHNSEKMAASGHFNCPLMPCWNVTGREEARTQLARENSLTQHLYFPLSLQHAAQVLVATHLNVNIKPSLVSLHKTKSSMT